MELFGERVAESEAEGGDGGDELADDETETDSAEWADGVGDEAERKAVPALEGRVKSITTLNGAASRHGEEPRWMGVGWGRRGAGASLPVRAGGHGASQGRGREVGEDMGEEV